MPFIPLFHRIIAASALCLAFPMPAQAAEGNASLPGTITLVVGYAPGGAADTVARVYAEQLRVDGAANVIVENKPGASGRIGLNYVKDAAPDGATLYLVPSPLLTIFPLTYKAPGYDARKDLRAIATLVDIPTAVVTGATRPYDGMGPFIDHIRQQSGGRASLGVATLGSSGHLGILALNADEKLVIEPVAYRGAAPMLVDVASGEVDIGWDAVASMMPLYQAGKIKFLGVSGTRRLEALPGVKTLAEQGYGQYKAATSFYGIMAPAKVSDETAMALEQAFLKASEDPGLQKQLAAKGLVMAPASGAALAKRASEELETWRPVVQATGIVMD